MSADSEELIRQVKRLFAAYARMPTADELYSYSRKLHGLTQDELEHAIDASIDPSEEGEAYRQPKDAGIILALALQHRARRRVGAMGASPGECGLCRGTGFKMVEWPPDAEMVKVYGYMPKRAVKCDCRKAVKL